MYADRHYPQQPIPPARLDEYLADGWFRMGQTIFTTRFLFFNNELYTAIWTRLLLDEHRFTKRQRKIMRRIRTRFRIEYGPLELDAERELLFRRYRQYRRRYGNFTLRQSLFDHKAVSVYDTWEVRIYDGDRLICYSHFDLGNTSVQSISGVFDPEYAGFSLGYASMLFEMEWCLLNGYTHYYPGYIVPGYPAFDYKRRIGNLEYLLLPEERWEPLHDLSEERIGSLVMETRLRELRNRLEPGTEIMFNPSFEMRLQDRQGQLMDTLSYPVFLLLFPMTVMFGLAYVVVYDDIRHVYQLASYNVVGSVGIRNEAQKFPANVFEKVLTIDSIVLETDDLNAMAEEVRSWGAANL